MNHLDFRHFRDREVWFEIWSKLSLIGALRIGLMSCIIFKALKQFFGSQDVLQKWEVEVFIMTFTSICFKV